MKIAVTGSSGFVGRRLTQHLLADNHQVIALSRRGSSGVPDGCTERDCDLSATELTPGLLDGVDSVVHLAAFLPSSYVTAAHARQCLEVNALGTLNLLLAAVAGGVKHFVYVSTGNAYAHAPGPVSEDSRMYPSKRATYYLASKLCGELYVDHFRHVHGLPTAVLRPSAIYGPGMAGGLIHSLAKQLVSGNSVKLSDNGLYAVDLVHVDDVVQAALAVLSKIGCGAFNVGSGRASTSAEVARTMVEILGLDDTLISLTPPRGGLQDTGFAPLDISRSVQELGYRPRDLGSGLTAYLGWMRDVGSSTLTTP